MILVTHHHICDRCAAVRVQTMKYIPGTAPYQVPSLRLGAYDLCDTCYDLMSKALQKEMQP